MAFVDDEKVVLADGWAFGGVGVEDDAFDEALDGADVDAGFGVGGGVAEAFEAEDVGEGFGAGEAGGGELVFGLVAEGGAVDDEADVAEAFGGEESVEEGDGEFGLAGARGHGDHEGLAVLGEGGFDGFDGGALVGAEGEGAVKGAGLEVGGGGVDVGFEEGLESFGGVPAGEGFAGVGGAAEVTEPDAGFGFELFEVGAGVGGEDEGDEEFVGVELGGGGVELDGAGVALGLVDGGGDVAVAAFGFDDGDAAGAEEEGVIGGAGGGGPFGDGEVAAFGGAGAVGVAEGVGVGFPVGVLELGIDEGAGGGFIEIDGDGGVAAGVYEGEGLLAGGGCGGDLEGLEGFELGCEGGFFGLRGFFGRAHFCG